MTDPMSRRREYWSLESKPIPQRPNIGPKDKDSTAPSIKQLVAIDLSDLLLATVTPFAPGVSSHIIKHNNNGAHLL